MLLLVACALSALGESKHETDEAKIRQRLSTYTEARDHGDAQLKRRWSHRRKLTPLH
jgi:hypothetical protein